MVSFYQRAGAGRFLFLCSCFVGLGIMDDLKDLSAKYKFIVQVGLASLIALSGIRINFF
jgi:UDP-N-acetylmuramyl pentapeptide phosphotransferase/UDP-N-acetylglucosamine-1-phosphate transferase